MKRNVNENILRKNLKACLHGGEGHLIGGVTCFGGGKKKLKKITLLYM